MPPIGTTLQHGLADKVGVAPVVFGDVKSRLISVGTGVVIVGGIDLSAEGEAWWEIRVRDPAVVALRVTLTARTVAAADPAFADLIPLPATLTQELAPFLGHQALRFFLPAGLPKINLAHDSGGTVTFDLVKLRSL